MTENLLPEIRIQLLGIITGVFFILLVSRLIITRKLREEYAIIWVIFSFLIFFFSIWRAGIDALGKLLGVYDPPNLIITIAIICILLYLLHLSIVVSKQKKQIKNLSQEFGILKQKWMDAEGAVILPEQK
ncbi:MAG: DUF2304 domain-containing protein [Bacteroidales bacterium]